MSYADTLRVIEDSKLSPATKERLRELFGLMTKKAAGMTPFELQRSRVLAGLSITQAARLLRVPTAAIQDWEADDTLGSYGRALWARVDEVYDTGNPKEAT